MAAGGAAALSPDRAWSEGGGAGRPRVGDWALWRRRRGGGRAAEGQGEPPTLTGIPETFFRAARDETTTTTPPQAPGAEPGIARCPRLSSLTKRHLPAPAARHPPGTRRASAARSPPHARPLVHSPAPGELSHRRLLPSLPPSCQVEPGLPPPDPSFATGSRRRPGPPSAAPGTAPLSPGSCRRRRGGSEEGEGRLRAAPVRSDIAPPGGPCVGRGGRLLPAGTPREAKGEVGWAGLGYGGA